MKKIVILITGVLLAVLLAACAADQPTPPAATPDTTTTAQPATTPDAAPNTTTTTQPTTTVTTPTTTTAPISPPASSATEDTRWSQAMENPNTYELTGNMSVEEAANQLVEMFMNALKEPDETRTFRLTGWKDLTVEIHPSGDALTEGEWGVREGSPYITDHTWLVYIEAFIQFEGIYNPVGPWIFPSDDWRCVLHQGSRRPLILTRTDTGYTLFAWQPEMEQS